MTDLFAPHPGRVSRVSFSRVAAPAVAGRRDAAGGETLAGGAGESPRGSGDASGSTSGESGAPPEGVAEEAASREGDPLAGAPEGEQDGDGVGAPAEGKGSSSSNAALRALTTASKKLSLGGSNSGSLLSVRPEERIRMVEEVYALEVDDLKHVGEEEEGGGQGDRLLSPLRLRDSKSSVFGAAFRQPLVTQEPLRRIMVSVAAYARTATSAVAKAKQEMDKADASNWLPYLRLLRTQLYAVMDAPESSAAALCVNILVMATILLSTTAFCLSTVPQMGTPYRQRVFDSIELASVVVFTADYGLRLLCCPDLKPFLLAPLNLVDVASIVPFYVQLGMDDQHSGSAGSSRVVRVIRVVRMLRVLKLGRRFERLRIVARALVESADMLLLLLFLIMVCLVTFGTAIHYAEQGTYLPASGFYSRAPWDQSCAMLDVATRREITTAMATPPLLNVTRSCRPLPTPFDSIPRSFYWCITTLLTVGYGDVEPITPLGRFVGAVCMIVGVLLLSLPVSIIGTEFTQQYLQFKASQGTQIIERRRHAPRFAALRRGLGSHNVLLDDILLRTRDALFEVDDLRSRMSNNHSRRMLELEAMRQARKRHKQHHRTTVSSLAAAQRDIKHDTEMLCLELELRHKLLKLADLIAQAELLHDPMFLAAVEHCRHTHLALQEQATSLASLTEEADDTEQALEDALAEDAKHTAPELWPESNTTWIDGLPWRAPQSASSLGPTPNNSGGSSIAAGAAHAALLASLAKRLTGKLAPRGGGASADGPHDDSEVDLERPAPPRIPADN